MLAFAGSGVYRVARPERKRWAWEAWQMCLAIHTPSVPQSVPHVSISIALLDPKVRRRLCLGFSVFREKALAIRKGRIDTDGQYSSKLKKKSAVRDAG